jgi:rare lipoprotein A
MGNVKTCALAVTALFVAVAPASAHRYQAHVAHAARHRAVFTPAAAGQNWAEFGVATYYENPFHHGYIAAHKSLPFGSRVRVRNLDNGRELIVEIVDRGPYAPGRIIDVSTTAATALGFRSAGIAHVKIDRI